MKLIVGLGNVGKDYVKTRHNVGFWAVDWLANEWKAEPWAEKNRLKSYVARSSEHDVLLAKPTTMMNNSGQAVRALMDFYKLKPGDIIIIHDDADLEVGAIKMSDQTNTGGGHHGVLSVLDHVGPDFNRIRIGIGRPNGDINDITGYVLDKLNEEDQLKIQDFFANLIQLFQ